VSEIKEHWASIYQTKSANNVSWFQPHLENSLKLILETGLRSGRVIDVGAGASTLVDDLLKRGFEVNVLDISAEALKISRDRLGEIGKKVKWIEADITEAKLKVHFYDIWHDRALFHFLTDPSDRKKYLEIMRSALKPSGHVIIASFDLTGPDKCSGLEIVKYSPEKMLEEVGGNFKLLKAFKEEHKTPWGSVQNFVYCHFQFIG
jgi:SAM-dependent methyltransferase